MEEPKSRRTQATGSGFVISADGYVVTNAHVVDGAKSITVGLNDRRELPAEVIGVDTLSDIALLKIKAENLPTVQLGDSSALEVGQWVVAIGAPFGLRPYRYPRHCQRPVAQLAGWHLRPLHPDRRSGEPR